MTSLKYRLPDWGLRNKNSTTLLHRHIYGSLWYTYKYSASGRYRLESNGDGKWPLNL